MMSESCSMDNNVSHSTKSKSKASRTSNVGGKKRLNDEMSSKLYKMSKF